MRVVLRRDARRRPPGPRGVAPVTAQTATCRGRGAGGAGRAAALPALPTRCVTFSFADPLPTTLFLIDVADGAAEADALALESFLERPSATTRVTREAMRFVWRPDAVEEPPPP